MKNKRKVKVFFTMDTEVNDDFEKHIEDNLLDKSKLIEFIIKKYLEDKKTKLILYTYDAFLFDYAEEDGKILQDIVTLLQYPVTIKQGQSYHGLEKI